MPSPGHLFGSDATSASPRARVVDLAVVSFLLLFLELAVIRWLPATIRVTAYFSNIVLVSCFLGMGIGCIVRARRDLLPTAPALFLALTVLATLLGRTGIAIPFQGHEYIFGFSGRLSWLWVLPLVFTVNALVFVGVGQRLARSMAGFRPLAGYSINVAASLAGTLAFTLLSFLRLPPLAWFAACALLTLWLLRVRRGPLALAVACLIPALALVHLQGRGFLWSPYYKIAVRDHPGARGHGFILDVNDDYHQMALDLSPKATAASPYLAAQEAMYGFPYRIRRLEAPCSVLILGAGTGNDAAAALRDSPCTVDAVELDPAIAELGRTRHPEKPYADPRVRLHATDARAFLAVGETRYDLIVFGWLDSHRLFSSLSNVRQDNFVYTVESMRQAKALLKEDGLLVLSFYVGKPWVGEKLYSVLGGVFGRPPLVFFQGTGGYEKHGHIFVTAPSAGEPALSRVPGFNEISAAYAKAPAAEAPTDDWPYLYYRSRRLSWEYAASLGGLLLVSALLVLPVARGGPISARDAAHFAFLGAGFLLLEVRNITTLAVVFGSTWLVSSVAIAGVLIMILAANAAVARGVGRSNPRVLWLLLAASIVLSLAGSRVGASATSHMMKAASATVAVSLTFLFAGLLFARAFERTSSPGTALGFNVLGAVAGGLSEYVSILVGMDGLALLALALYALAAATAPRSA